VVGDREDVEARPPVVSRERIGLELAVGPGRVRVQRAAQPLAIDCEWVGAIRCHTREDTTTAPCFVERAAVRLLFTFRPGGQPWGSIGTLTRSWSVHFRRTTSTG